MALLSTTDRVKVGMRKFKKVYRKPLSTLDDLGDQLGFYGRALGWTPRTLKRYKKETMRLLAEVTFGSGALAVIGGTVGVIAFLSFFTGTEVGLQGYAALDQLGTSAFTGFLSAYFNTREIAPLVAGLALSATVGCGFTAQIGAMRINEEIDALEVMGIRSVAFLASTRVIAGFLVVIPLYCVGVLMAFWAARFGTTVLYGQSTGVYDHYFKTFLNPTDLMWSFGQCVALSMVIMLVHTYYGFTARGGPAGVGEAVGRAVRTSLIVSAFVLVMLSLAVYGQSGNFNLAG
jgi:phospholipid/cholesterol/gamma-HCH transport system permease protein